MLLDIHTHRLLADASAALLSCCMRDVPLPEGARFISAGIHPWYLTREDYPRQLEWVVSMPVSFSPLTRPAGVLGERVGGWGVL